MLVRGAPRLQRDGLERLEVDTFGEVDPVGLLPLRQLVVVLQVLLGLVLLLGVVRLGELLGAGRGGNADGEREERGERQQSEAAGHLGHGRTSSSEWFLFRWTGDCRRERRKRKRKNFLRRVSGAGTVRAVPAVTRRRAAYSPFKETLQALSRRGDVSGIDRVFS